MFVLEFIILRAAMLEIGTKEWDSKVEIFAASLHRERNPNWDFRILKSGIVVNEGRERVA